MPGAAVMFLAPAPDLNLTTGRFQWRLAVTDSINGQRTFTGPLDYVSREDSSLGTGWSISSADALLPENGGLNLVRGSGGTT